MKVHNVIVTIGAQQLCELIDVYESVPPVTYHSGGLLLNNFEQTSCFNLQMDKLRSESQLSNSKSSGTIGRSKGASIVLSNPEISVTVVTEFVRWNEEAISRCSLFYLQVYMTCSKMLLKLYLNHLSVFFLWLENEKELVIVSRLVPE